MRRIPVLATLGLSIFACNGGDTEGVETDERVSICNRTEVAWETVGTTAQAATVCASSWPSCNCFVIGGSHFEEEHLCMMVELDAMAQDVAITGEAGWTLESSPAGTDCSSGIPCIGDLPQDTEIVVVATLPESIDVEAQEVEITFTATGPRLEGIYVECP